MITEVMTEEQYMSVMNDALDRCTDPLQEQALKSLLKIHLEIKENEDFQRLLEEAKSMGF